MPSEYSQTNQEQPIKKGKFYERNRLITEKIKIDMIKEAMYQNWVNDPFGEAITNWQYYIKTSNEVLEGRRHIFFFEASSYLPGRVGLQIFIKENNLPPTIEVLNLS